jgi:hypothetical protein
VNLSETISLQLFDIASVAQLAEQGTLNPKVEGSIPSGRIRRRPQRHALGRSARDHPHPNLMPDTGTLAAGSNLVGNRTGLDAGTAIHYIIKLRQNGATVV